VASQRALDSRRLITLANAARKAGILELEVRPDGGVRFTLGAPAPVESKRPAPVAVDARPDTGSLEGLRRRFERRQA
jgi:hypothetical protein